MFKITDGRSHFYQWDSNRRLTVEDPEITQVHFCNRTDDCSLVRDVYTEDKLRLVDVPNILLQTNWRINVYAFDKNYTKHCATFDVIARSKPADYVYTEEELKTWEALDERLDALEEGGSVDLSDYYTKEEIDGLIPDVSGYQTAQDVQAAITEALNAIGIAEEGEY
jgi:hypothetical protein